MISIWFPPCLILASPPRCRRSAWPLEFLGLGNLTWLEKPWKSRMNGWTMAGKIYHKWKNIYFEDGIDVYHRFQLSLRWMWILIMKSWRLKTLKSQGVRQKVLRASFGWFSIAIGPCLILIKTVCKTEDTDACAIGGLQALYVRYLSLSTFWRVGSC